VSALRAGRTAMGFSAKGGVERFDFALLIGIDKGRARGYIELVVSYGLGGGPETVDVALAHVFCSHNALIGCYVLCADE